MTLIHEIDSLDDPRIALYRNLTDRDLTERGEWFIAEAALVVERLLASDFEVDSVLAIPAKAARMRELAKRDIPVYVAPRALLQEIVGFKFHMGVMAVARQRLYTELDEVMERVFADRQASHAHADASPAVVMVLPHLNNPQNLGAIVRSAAAFGAAAVMLGPGGTNPYWRYAVRVSMGAMFALPLIRSMDLAHDLDRLKSRWGFERVAAVLDDDAQSLIDHARNGSTSRTAIVLGSEDDGIDEQWLDHCDRKVIIPMASGVDSLNVAMSAAVMLYHFTQVVRW